ncbi:MAG: 6-phosphofructokinase, partial [Lachnospiraceae bacterium]|nr:6-phosphofructokinase [Lachnospiraceae bacterium]
MLRIGMLTSGGDCQALNAAMRGVVKGLGAQKEKLEVYGFIDGYKGLMYEKYKKLTSDDFSGILTQGGTILGTSRQPFKQMRNPDENGLDKVEAMKSTYKKLKLDCLVVLGGNGTQKTANLLREEGLNVIHLPKTIDNDIWGTDVTFGFQSAVDIATNAIDCIHTTAASHSRVFIVEIMGHKVGWITLFAGIAGGADIILLPEIPYDMDEIIKALEKRNKAGKKFSILAVAEGAISKEDAALSKKELKAKKAASTYPSV